MIAYGLIVLMVAAAVALLLFVRRNSHAQKVLRDRKRDQARREEQILKK